ncbi:MAG: hypothetical protein LKK00_03725 [Intestinimonas sp.]|jgi:hypothetical protein|nr:hypothetical protein [Intestinimonas sp.]
MKQNARVSAEDAGKVHPAYRVIRNYEGKLSAETLVLNLIKAHIQVT